MTYNETVEYLFKQLPVYHRIGKAAYKNDLVNTITLDNYFNNPHRKYKTIHIAGTNGKGSVSHMTASVLQDAGIRTGLYTSPHLKEFRERIKIDGEMISKRDVVEFVKNNIEIIEAVKPSFFEITVAMAFNHFAENNVEIAVIEVGLGGRLDSTNIINPVLSVITNIGHDHMDLLGNSIEKVAKEKAGIIKENTPVLIGEKQQVLTRIFLSIAKKSNADIIFSNDLFTCNFDDNLTGSGTRNYRIFDLLNNVIHEGIIPLAGNYQRKNLCTVYSIFRALESEYNIAPETIAEGIKNVVLNTGLQGRWQIIGDKPLTICDTGHNKEGLECVLEQLVQIPNSGLHIVLGFVNDKDMGSVLPLFPREARYYFTRASIPRALDEKVLKDIAGKFGLKGEACRDVKQAAQEARKNAGESGLVFIGGSTFIVAEIL